MSTATARRTYTVTVTTTDIRDVRRFSLLLDDPAADPLDTAVGYARGRFGACCAVMIQPTYADDDYATTTGEKD